MSARFLTACILATAAIAPVHAQTSGTDTTSRSPTDEYQRGYAATPMPDQANINAGGAPGTAALNGAVASATQVRDQAAMADQAETQAQYDADRAAYMDALMKHDAAVNRSDARYARQQVAYADAMRAWRRQVWACHHGHPSACKLPAPNPASYY